MRPRLDKDVTALIEKNAAENSRSATKELNYVVRKFYTYQDNVKTMGKIVRKAKR